jgi:hypothetical protein
MACLILCLCFFSFLCHVFHLETNHASCFFLFYAMHDFMFMIFSFLCHVFYFFPFFMTWAADLLLGLAQMGCSPIHRWKKIPKTLSPHRYPIP